MSDSGLGDRGIWEYPGPMSSHEIAPRVGDTLTTSASALVGIVREVVAHDTTPDLFRVRITVDAGTPDEFDKWTMVRVG
jgi:hypothetical protein